MQTLYYGWTVSNTNVQLVQKKIKTLMHADSTIRSSNLIQHTIMFVMRKWWLLLL